MLQLTGREEPVERTLHWRFKTGSQAAVRKGDWKYLRLAGGEYLFNLADDLRERARLQEKNPEKFAELRALFEEWNSGMLPYSEESFSELAENTYTDRY